jgi:hypothetical protein
MNRSWIRLDRHELAGSFGDLGTSLPLLVGMSLACGLDAASVFIMFGLGQIVTGLIYGLPMPMQPLKVMAVVAIAQQIAGDTLYGGGLAVGLAMLVLTLSGGLTTLARWIPRCTVRGIQCGLGLSLAWLAARDYLPAQGAPGIVFAVVAGIVMLVLRGNRLIPGGLVVVLIGVVYALWFRLDLSTVNITLEARLPRVHVPAWSDVATGFLVLALPQLPLSLSNSVIATSQTVSDLFPHRRASAQKIGLTYSIANLAMPWFSGVPVCLGAGGLAGHYAFGARTGGSVVLYGLTFVTVGLLFSNVLGRIIHVFPIPILGVALLFEALTLLSFVRDQVTDIRKLAITSLVALLAFTLPQGYAIGLAAGTGLYYCRLRRRSLVPEGGARAPYAPS